MGLGEDGVDLNCTHGVLSHGQEIQVRGTETAW